MNGTEGWNGWERTRCLMSGPAKLGSNPVVSARSEKEGVTEGIGNSRVGQHRRA